MTERHQEALAHLYHGIESDAGFVLLTGDVGTGKTTVCRRFLSNLPQNTQIAFILNPCLDGLELLHAICKELGIGSVPQDASLRQLTDKIYEFLLANHAKGINTVLLIDEAQQLYKHVLELIRILTNLETNTQKLLKIILVGQPELNGILAKSDLKQLSQRITARYHINPLSVKEVAAYIEFRLRTAGYTAEKKIFSSSMVKQVYATSEGVPRIINVLCDRALLGVYSQNKKEVNKAILDKAIEEVQGNYQSDDEPQKSNGRGKAWLWLAVASISVVSALAYYSHDLPFDLPFELPSVFLPQNNPGVAVAHKEHSILPEPTVAEKKPESAPLLDQQEQLEADVESVEKTVKESIDENVQGSAEKNAEENLASAPPETEQFEDKTEPAYFFNKQEALNALIKTVIPPADAQGLSANECSALGNIQWQCSGAVVLSWQQFKKYNRPAVITLNAQQQLFYVTVVGLDDNKAWVLADSGNGANDSIVTIPLIQLGENWLGEFTYLWQPPSGFSRFIYKNSSEDLVDWLAQAFADIDGRSKALANGKYNDLLKQRIILFQKKYGLKEDGKAGVETLLKLNEERGIAITLDRPAKHVSSLLTVTDQP